MSSPCALDAPPFPEKLKHIAFVGLIPGDGHGGDGADVESFDVGEGEELLDPGRVLGDGADGEGVSDLGEHLGLWEFDDTGVGAEELAVAEGVTEGIAVDDSGAEVGAAFEDDLAEPAPVGGSDIGGTGGAQALLDLCVDEIGHFGVGEAGEPGLGIVGKGGLDGAEALGEGIGDLAGVFGNDDGGGIDAGTSAVIGDGGGDDVDEVGPVLDLVLTDEDFAPAGAMDLDIGVGCVLGGGGFVAEDEAATAGSEDLAGAFVVGGVEAKGLGGATGGDEGLDEAEGGPGFFAAGLDDDGGFEGDGWEPERVDGG